MIDPFLKMREDTVKYNFLKQAFAIGGLEAEREERKKYK